MKEGKILGMFNTLRAALIDQERTIQAISAGTGQSLRQIQTRVQFTAMYVNSMMEYFEKYWILPVGFFPGNKLFAKIYKRNIEAYNAELKKRQEEAIEAQKAAKAAQKEKENENKEVSDQDEGRTDQQLAVDSTPDQG